MLFNFETWFCLSLLRRYTEVGKHVAFDGRLLHGVARALASSAARGGGRGDGGEGSDGAGQEGAEDNQQEGSRMTFLVNVWLNHRPKVRRCKLTLA